MWWGIIFAEGAVAGVLLAWLRWRCTSPMAGMLAVGIIVLILVGGCATPPPSEPTKASRWMGACTICRMTA